MEAHWEDFKKTYEGIDLRVHMNLMRMKATSQKMLEYDENVFSLM